MCPFFAPGSVDRTRFQESETLIASPGVGYENEAKARLGQEVVN
ncbi:MAG: hypothetical protein V7638_132 [Acidobacteriota bacterium]|jgi:hypothetical protein